MDFTLPLLPPYGLDNSILLAVFVGLLVLAGLTETFGWVFAGLVVPGYLASVFVIQPEAGATIAFEAVLTWAVCRLVSGPLARTGAWSAFFGRERFLLIVLVSVFVRAVDELWLLPEAARLVDGAFGTELEARRTFFSIGLVLVPLTANALWKLPFARGVFQVGLPVALTYACLRWVLLPHTNLSFGSFALTYEDVALDFLASPKTYIVLLATAWLAARWNLRYGWDFNGVLVPALLATAWFEPAKVAATIAEVAVVVAAAKVVLKAPVLRTANLEGPRRTVLVFAVGFAAKFAVSWALGGRLPGLKVTDLFGFGYLVPTLLAVKILQKKATSRVVLPAVATSMAGVALGSAAAFVLHLFEPPSPHGGATAVAGRPARSALLVDATSAMGLARAKARPDASGRATLVHDARDLLRYGELWRGLASFAAGSGDVPRELAERAARLGLALEPLDADVGGRRAFALVETEQRLAAQSGWDTAVIVPGAPGPVLVVPRPWIEPPSAEAAAALCARLACRVLVASGIDGIDDPEAARAPGAPLRIAVGRLAPWPSVYVRLDRSGASSGPVLHVGASGPGALGGGRAWAPVATMSWEPAPESLRAGASAAVLRASAPALWALALEGTPPVARVERTPLAVRLASQAVPAGRVSTPPGEVELRYYEELVAGPLLAEGSATRGAASFEDRVRWAARAASPLGIDVELLEDCSGRARACVVAAARDGARWPLLAVRERGASAGISVRQLERERAAGHLAADVWSALDARAFIASVTPPPGTREVATPFLAAFHAVHRALRASDGLLLEVRGVPTSVAREASELVVSAAGPLPAPGRGPEALRELFAPGAALAALAPLTTFVDGSRSFVALPPDGAALDYADAMGGALGAVLFVSDRLREAHVPTRRQAAEALFAQVGLEMPDEELSDALGAGGLVAPRGARTDPSFEAAAALAERFQAHRDVHELRRLVRSRGATLRIEARWCPSRGAEYLLVESRQGEGVVRGAFFLDSPPRPRTELVAGPGLALEIARAALGRSPLVVRGRRGGAP